MKFFQNPVSGELKSVSRLEAKRLQRYGWREITKAEYNEIRNALHEKILLDHLNPKRQRVH